MSLYIYLCMLFNFVQIEIFSSHEFSTIFVFSTSLDLAITILSLTLDVQRHKHKVRPVHDWRIA